MSTTAVADIICAVFIALLYARHYSDHTYSKSNRILNVCLMLLMLTLIDDALAYTLIGPAYPLALRYLINFLSFLSGCINTIAFTYYTEALLSEKTDINPWAFRILKTAEFCWALITAYEFIAGHLLVYENGIENLNYSFPVYVVVLQMTIMLYLPILTFVKRRKIGTQMAILLCLFDITPVIGSALYNFFGYDFVYVFAAISIGFVVEFVQKKQTRLMKDEQAASIALANKQLEEQQARLQNALEAANLEAKRNDVVISIVNAGKFIYEISADDEVTGAVYSDISKERIGEAYLDKMDWTQLLHPDDKEQTLEAFESCIHDHSGNTPYDITFRMMGANGRYRWVRSGGNVIRRADGSGEFYGISFDITDQMEEQQERVNSEHLADELVISKLRADSLAYIEDNDPDLDKALDFFGRRILDISGCDQVVYREPSGHRIVLNAPGVEDVPAEICAVCPFAKFDCDLFGEEGRVLMNDCSQGCRGVYPPEDCPARSSFMQLIYSGGELVGKLTVHYLKECHTFSENMIEIMKVVAVYLGLYISRIKAKQDQMARIEAEMSNKAKTEFLFNMSHDIRTPMNAIIGFTDKAIKNQHDPAVLEEALGKVKSSSDYLLSIINDILDMAKIESGTLELREELYAIGGKANPLIEVFAAEAARKGIQFNTSYNAECSYIWLDINRTNQIIANLISNAIKYTNSGGSILYSIDQQPGGKDGYVRITASVKDTGRGMSPEFLTKIFDSFERDQSAIKSGEQGTGLGMAIVKKLSDAMGGTVEVQSELGRGTTVSFTCEHRIATPEEIENYKAQLNSADEKTDVDFTGRKVLLAEDNELNREIANDILTEAGLTVENAEDGTQAVAMIMAHGPAYYDFVLMDIQMPVMNGYEATKSIRSMYPDAAIPIIALSANAFDEDKKQSLAAGMNEHVAKPINIEELKTAMAKFLK